MTLFQTLELFWLSHLKATPTQSHCSIHCLRFIGPFLEFSHCFLIADMALNIADMALNMPYTSRFSSVKLTHIFYRQLVFLH